MIAPSHQQDGWDMHDHGKDLFRTESLRLPAGATVTGVVVCHHVFGIGLYLEDRDEYAHVDVVSIGTGRIHSPEDYPPIGSTVQGVTLGYTGSDAQLRVTLITPEAQR